MAGSPQKIVEKSYIATGEKTSAKLALEWFASNGSYPRRPNNYILPLVNGQQAFTTVAGAIKKAKKSIDIISWGFDASMRFERPGGDRIGEILKRKGNEGVKVRLVIWRNPTVQLMENTVPGANQMSGPGSAILGTKDIALSGANKLSGPEKNQNLGYGTSAPGKVLNSAGARGDPSAASFNRAWHNDAQEGNLKNLEFRTRDFSDWDRLGIEYRQLFNSSDKNPWAQFALMSLFPSHHQKMVTVDYEDPEFAVGFVMGHNMHNNYWDTSAHHYDDAMGFRVSGFGPWQDLSVMVRGCVLYDLNTNFVKAWDKGSPFYRRWFNSLQSERENLKPASFATQPSSMNSSAQICRTQPQEGAEQSIKEIYMLAASNARKYIYVENQYFRFPPWAEKLKQTRKALLAGGKSEQEHGTCHVFVVTNVPEDTGRMNTHRMLQSLGKERSMPTVEKKVNPNFDSDEIVVTAIPGLKIHICTLMSATQQTAANHYRPIYVHSKLLVVDDVFFTLGSANINTRSMEVDSELNIASNDPEKASSWREQLFALHTGSAPSNDPSAEYDRWSKLLDKNSTLLDAGKPLQGKLVAFFDGGGASTAMD